MTLEILTHSKRQAFQNCRRFYLHRHLEHLQLRSQKPGRRRGTIFGAIIHDFNEAAAENPLLTDQPGMCEQFCQDLAALAYDQLRDAGAIDGNDIAESEVEEVKVATMAEQYIKHYGMDRRREVEFYLPLVNPRTNRSSRAFKIGGKIDGVKGVHIGTHGRNVATIVEDKFVGQIQRAMIMRLPLDAQVTEYADAFHSKGWDAMIQYRHTLCPRINPHKEKIPPAFTPSGKPSKAKHVPAETLTEFAQRIREEIVEDPGKYFDEQTLYFPIDHMEDYRAGRWGIAQQILEARRVFRKFDSRDFAFAGIPLSVAEAFPMNSSRCWEYGGCEFIPLCTKLEGARDLYVVEEDNPELSHGRDEGVTSTYAGTD